MTYDQQIYCYTGIRTNLMQLQTCNSLSRHDIQLQFYPVRKIHCHLTLNNGSEHCVQELHTSDG